MRWNGKNFRPKSYGKQAVNPRPMTGGLDTSKMKWVASYFAGPLDSGETPVPSPSPSPTPTPTPTPSPSPAPACDFTYEYIAEATISPTGTTQYENITLSGSSNLSNSTYIWTLTDFYDVSGNTITSYTGSPLTEGYFSTTGSSNVSLSVVGQDPFGNTLTATTTNFSISAFDINSYQSNMYLWVDYSDSSTLSTRIDGSNTYITQIDNKATNSNINNFSETTAAEQPLLQSGGTLFNNSSLTYGYYPSGSTDIALVSDQNITGQTHHHFVVFHSEQISTTSQHVWAARFNSLYPIYYLNIQPNVNNPLQGFRNTYPGSILNNQRFIYSMNVVGQANVVESRIDLTTATDGNYIVNSGMTINDIDYGVNEITSAVGPQELNANPYDNVSLLALGNTPESSRGNQMNGAIAEYIVFPTILSESDRRKINRYLIYKWVA